MVVQAGYVVVSGKNAPINSQKRPTYSKRLISKGEHKLSMPYKINLKMVCSDKKTTRIMHNILLPEIKSFSSQRAKIIFNIENGLRQIQFFIEATDVTALRSTINSILRLIVLINTLYKTIKS